MISFRCGILRPPSSAFTKHRTNLIVSNHYGSVLINGNLKSITPTHSTRSIRSWAANGRGTHQHANPQTSMTTIVPQQTSFPLNLALAGSRSTRKGLSLNQHSDQHHYTQSCNRDSLSSIFSRPTPTLDQPYYYQRQLHHCKTIFRPSIASGVDSISPFLSQTLGYNHEEGTAKMLKPRKGTPSFQQNREFTSSSVNLSQPYYAMKNSQGDTLRIHLAKSRNFVGIRSTRCQREFNQDRYKVVVLNPPSLSPDIIATFSKGGKDGLHNTEGAQMDANNKSLFYFAIFDGHGGSNTCDFLTAHLDSYIDEAEPKMVPTVIKDLRKLGGYFRSFRPHELDPFLPSNFEEKHGVKKPEQARIQIKGKGGRIRPMIFIPHPNATEEEQHEDIEFLEGRQGEDAKPSDAKPSDAKPSDTKPSDANLSPVEPFEKETEDEGGKQGQVYEDEKVHDRRIGKDGKVEGEEEDEEYDEEEDPFVLARRRYKNRTSPLPGGTVAYSGTHQSEYGHLVIRDPKYYNKEIGDEAKSPTPTPAGMTLEQRLCLSFLKCDAELVRDKYRDGSTASVVVVQSKGPFWETGDDLDLVIAHVGDTRILLCEAPDGESVQLTTDHHPDATVETERIRKMAAYVSADSFGENMFMGRVANTRALGDIALKPYGVSAEPEIIRRTIKANDAAFLVLISDGITGVMSNQEVVDCVKLEKDPTSAAANVLSLAEQLGAEDNCTVLVVRLPAWGKQMPDLSKDLREYRFQSEAQQSRSRRR
ncbi:hypothetical protein BGZ76_006162 [Entomortierella beljakovae]|nr:hypothetical protein BGZ76_006162 [Entomortierella beljakovae]